MESYEKSSIIENLPLVQMPPIFVYPTNALLAVGGWLTIGFHKS